MIIIVEVEVEKTAGAFRSKDAVVDAIRDALDGTDLEVEESSYSVVSVDEFIAPKPAKKAKA